VTVDPMHRLWPLIAVVPLLACGSATKAPAPHRVAATSAPVATCPELTGCAVALPAEPRFEPPGEPPIQPEPPDAPIAASPCATVGEALAAIELGNYADPNELAPAIARGTARCEQLALDPATIACVIDQTDRPSIAYCAPTMFPGEAPRIVEPRECEAQIAEIARRTSARSRIDGERRWWEARSAGYLQSCRTDRWTHAFAECARATLPNNCTYGAVKPLQAALQAMLAREDNREHERRAAWEAAYASPKQHPKVKLELVSARGCASIMRTAQKRIDALHPTDWQRGWWSPRAAGFRKSCLRDRWPKDYGQCVGELGPNSCHAFAPSVLQHKLQVVFQLQVPPTRPPKPAKPAKPPRPPRRR